MVGAKSLLVPFRYSHKVAFVVEFSHLKIRLYAQGKLFRPTQNDSASEFDFSKVQMMGVGEVKINGVVSNSGAVDKTIEPLVINSPYSYDDLWDDDELCWKIQTIQNCDVLYIFHEKYPIKTLKRYANNDWRLEDLELLNGPFMAMNTSDVVFSVSNTAVGAEAVLNATKEVFSSTDVGRLIRFHADENDAFSWVAGRAVTKNQICYSDKKYYQAVNTGTTGANKPAHSEGVRTDGGVQWKYLHDGSGVVKVAEYISETKVGVEVMSMLPSGVVDGTPAWELGMLHDGANYPIAGAFFRNRFAFLINTINGPNVCFSVNGDYNNFADRECGEATAQTAIIVPVLGREFNEGKWLCANDVLFVGTGAAEFYIDAVSGSSAMAADNVKIQQISSVGSKAITPVEVGGHVFFADRYGLSLRDLLYNYYNEGYDPIDMSLLGKHLFASRIVAMCYQETPDKILWCLMGDGSMTALTFSAEQEVAALSRHDFNGVVESMAVIPNLSAARDEMWIEVKRLVNLKTVRSVEWVENGMPQIYPLSVLKNASLLHDDAEMADYVLKMAAYLDGAVLFERELDDDGEELSGLDHLEGEMIALFADGVVLPPQRVVDGKVGIKKTYTRILAGLPVKSQYVPQNMYIPTENSAGVGQRQRINHVLLTFYLSGGGKLGQDENTLSDILYRSTDAAMDFPQKLFSGNKEVLFNGSTSICEQAASIYLENTSPLPMNILAIVPSIDVS